MMKLLIHTDFGGDPDDAIALSFLIEHNVKIDTIVLTPGHVQQNQALSGFLNLYGINPDVYSASTPEYKHNLRLGKYEMFYDGSQRKVIPFYMAEEKEYDRALVIGPAKGISSLKTASLFFQGGYSPNSIKPLPKFIDETSVQSFNPSGAKKEFLQLLNSEHILYRYYIGKNVCHGFTKESLENISNWTPKQKRVREFYDKLSPDKAMHDVLAAMCMIDNSIAIWEQAEPVFVDGLKMSTVSTSRDILSLIGINTITRFNHEAFKIH